MVRCSKKISMALFVGLMVSASIVNAADLTQNFSDATKEKIAEASQDSNMAKEDGKKIEANINALKTNVENTKKALEQAKVAMQAAKEKADKAGASETDKNAYSAAKSAYDHAYENNSKAKLIEDTAQEEQKTAKVERGVDSSRTVAAQSAPANLNQRITDNTTRINHLENKVNKGMALMAAMSSVDVGGVSVGKIRVAGAIGGYANKQAIAIGVGTALTNDFRINAKMSVSTDDSKTNAYAIGASYDF